MPSPVVYQVAVPSPLRRLFDYLPPGEARQALKPGTRVKVPFGRRQVIGIIIKTVQKSSLPLGKLKPISAILDLQPLLSEPQFNLHLWAAQYYQHPVGDALAASLPALIRKGEPVPVETVTHWQLTTMGLGLPESALRTAPRQQQLLNALQKHARLSTAGLKNLGISRQIIKQVADKKLIESIEVETEVTDWNKSNILAEAPHKLTRQQSAALNSINTNTFNTYLLQGETGSGKTEVYLQLIQTVVETGKQALVLIPEISLTPQTLQRFQQRFNCSIAVMHSGLTDKERALAWNAARTGRVPIVLGTRSAIFTPLANPGLIIVDEEHDSSFKQQEGFRYSARDIAVIRAQREKTPLLLGSATPSLESLHNCHQGKYHKLTLTGRPGNARQPQWQLVDLRQSQLKTGFSATLINAMEDELAQGNQVLVFLNRRGFAPTLNCHNCGWIADCHRCSARLTVHKSSNRLLCHHCEHQEPVPLACPACMSSQLQFLGQGTERSESLLEALFPETPILRVDRDTTRRKSAMQSMVEKMNSGKPCILVGTQMLAKGHHFPNVTLVVILDADGGLFSPDFRAPEKMGQLITQVAGRAGRGEKPGKVILQSHYCDHPMLTTLSQRGYVAFSDQLLNERKLAQLPPFQYLCVLRSEAPDVRDADQFLRLARQHAERLAPPSPQFGYLGPLPPAMEKRSGRYRRQLSIHASSRPRLQQLLTLLCQQLEQTPLGKKVRWSVDVDPVDMS